VLVSIVLVPTLILMNLIAVQAYELSQDLIPWIEHELDSPKDLELQLPAWFPFRDSIEGSSQLIASKVGQFATRAGGFIVDGLSAATMGTAHFFLQLFVMVYAMFFFLREGPAVVEKLIGYSPLPRDVQMLLIGKGLSVTRATLKGSVVIGLVQGTLGGVAFAVVGIQGAAFWGAVMAVASVIPSIGTAIVWVPAVVYLFATGESLPAVGLMVWSAVLVGTIDNVLRPRLVGGETKMSDLTVLVSTFGGLATFGAAGLILGPVIAAVFFTVWDVFARADEQAADPANE